MGHTLPITCLKCGAALPAQLFNTVDKTECPFCENPFRVHVFPALFKAGTGQQAGDRALGNESVCFFHPQKIAVVPCAMCGRFLCGLCDVEFGGSHVCPLCLEAGRKKRKIRDLETQRVLYDDIALSLAIIPMLFIFITIVTAPVSIFLAVRHWNSPLSIVPRTKVRFMIAIALSTLQIAGWALVLSGVLDRL